MTETQRRGRRGGAALLGLALTLSVGMTGCSVETNAAEPKPKATAVPTPDSPDLSLRRDFTLPDGSVEQGCLALTAKIDPSTATASAPGDLATVRAILREARWRDEPVSLNEVPPTKLNVMKDRGETEAVILAGVLKDHIQAAIDQAGVGNEITTSGFVGCR